MLGMGNRRGSLFGWMCRELHWSSGKGDYGSTGWLMRWSTAKLARERGNSEEVWIVKETGICENRDGEQKKRTRWGVLQSYPRREIDFGFCLGVWEGVG